MDSLVYRYQTNRNRLTHVDDPGGVAGNHSFDVDDQDTNTYTYDASGNMIGDTASGITAIVWTPSNKIQRIEKGSTSKIEYTYDAMGNRVVKRFYQPTSTLKSTTWYARDAQGNILSVYERPHADSAIKQSEVHIYGSSRLGIEQRGITYSTSNYAWIGSEQHRNAGSKHYELTDHLGNVRVTISDLLIARPTGFGDTTQDAEVIDRRDYYPFGMEMPGRRWRASGEDAARFGFNGKENDNEVNGEGNQQDYGFRIYDPRIARFLSVDPLARAFAWNSPYGFCENRPVWGRDLEGGEFMPANYVSDFMGKDETPIKVVDATLVADYASEMANLIRHLNAADHTFLQQTIEKTLGVVMIAKGTNPPPASDNHDKLGRFDATVNSKTTITNFDAWANDIVKEYPSLSNEKALSLAKRSSGTATADELKKYGQTSIEVLGQVAIFAEHNQGVAKSYGFLTAISMYIEIAYHEAGHGLYTYYSFANHIASGGIVSTYMDDKVQSEKAAKAFQKYAQSGLTEERLNSWKDTFIPKPSSGQQSTKQDPEVKKEK